MLVKCFFFFYFLLSERPFEVRVVVYFRLEAGTFKCRS
jgi:hypothetical protein